MQAALRIAARLIVTWGCAAHCFRSVNANNSYLDYSRFGQRLQAFCEDRGEIYSTLTSPIVDMHRALIGLTKRPPSHAAMKFARHGDGNSWFGGIGTIVWNCFQKLDHSIDRFAGSAYDRWPYY
jgi:hypothetical protein